MQSESLHNLNMRKTFYALLMVILSSVLLFSCSEKDATYRDASSDMLISVFKDSLKIELQNTTKNTHELEQVIRKRLEEKICFFKGNVYEMLLVDDREVDLYEHMNDYRANKLKIAGEYLFEDDMYVNFDIEGENKKYKISGSFGNGFYNHYARKTSGGKPHVYPEQQVFSLEIDYTEELKNEFPELVSACIKTDMITARALQSVKIK